MNTMSMRLEVGPVMSTGAALPVCGPDADGPPAGEGDQRPAVIADPAGVGELRAARRAPLVNDRPVAPFWLRRGRRRVVEPDLDRVGQPRRVRPVERLER